MSTINYTYNVIVDRFRQFAAGHFQLRRFTHGEISQADLEKEAEWPWMHVKPRAINYSPGTRAFSFEVFISDLPRDKEDKTVSRGLPRNRRNSRTKQRSKTGNNRRTKNKIRHRTTRRQSRINVRRNKQKI